MTQRDDNKPVRTPLAVTLGAWEEDEKGHFLTVCVTNDRGQKVPLFRLDLDFVVAYVTYDERTRRELFDVSITGMNTVRLHAAPDEDRLWDPEIKALPDLPEVKKRAADMIVQLCVQLGRQLVAMHAPDQVAEQAGSPAIRTRNTPPGGTNRG